METVELLTLIEKHQGVVLILLVRPRPGNVAEDADAEPCSSVITHSLVTDIFARPPVQDMVCSKEASLAQRALGVLQVLLSGHRDYEPDLCGQVRPALLRALQKLSVENAGRGRGQAQQGEFSK